MLAICVGDMTAISIEALQFVVKHLQQRRQFFG